jgi:hypothetical protein
MPLKSNQTNKYETACFVQEAPTLSEMGVNGYTVKRSAENLPYCEFESTMMTFNEYNRMKRRYDANNVATVIATDERINDLLRRNQWRGEWNHPNPDIKGQQYSDIRMTIPEPIRTSHFITKPRLEGDRYRAHIITHPRTECGRAVASEIIDIGAVPCFSVRLLGNMIPNAPVNQPNMRVSKVITFDMVDFPSHAGAQADITPTVHQEGSVVFLKELAKYCCEQDESMKVVCESFEFSTDEIMGINNGSIVVEQANSRIHIPLRGKIRQEAMSLFTEGGF